MNQTRLEKQGDGRWDVVSYPPLLLWYQMPIKCNMEKMQIMSKWNRVDLAL